jgi:hypothetical protein
VILASDSDNHEISWLSATVHSFAFGRTLNTNWRRRRMASVNCRDVFLQLEPHSTA